MAGSSNEAADRVNSLIDKVANLADAQTTNAGGYANQAINAFYNLGTTSSVPPIIGGSINYTAPSLPPPESLPPAIPMPPMPSIAGIASGLSFAGILGNLESSLTGFLNEFFPPEASGTAIRQLEQMASQAAGAIDVMQRRMGDDFGARSYLGTLMTGTGRARDRLAESVEGGSGGSAYLGARYSSGNAATAFLLTKFRQGDVATAKLIEMMTSGGTAIPAAVENQVWQRDRARVLAETRKQKQTVIDSWAARGYPLPPGGAAMAVMMIESEGQDRIAQSSRERAIKDVEILIENIKFAAGQAVADASGSGRALMEDGSGASKVMLDDARAATQLTLDNAREAAKVLLDDSMMAIKSLVDTAVRAAEPLVRMRSDAIGAAVEFIRASALGPQLQADLVKTQIQAASAASRAQIDYFMAQISASNAQLNAKIAISQLNTNSALELSKAGLSAQIAMADLAIKPAIANATNATQLMVEDDRLRVAVAEAKSKVAMAAATSMSNIASSALTSLHASANLTQNS